MSPSLSNTCANGAITQPTDTGWGAVGEPAVDYVVKTKLWKYEPGIKTTEQLWDNFKRILEQHNQATLDHPLSVVEFKPGEKDHFGSADAVSGGGSSFMASMGFRRLKSIWTMVAMRF